MCTRFNKNQIISVLCGNLVAMGYGAVCGWPSPSLLTLQSDLTPLPTGPLTTDEVSWMMAMIGIAGIPGNILYGWIGNRYGRKIPMLSLGIPQIISWLLIIFATCPLHLYISRALGGLSGAGVFVLVPSFISEVADDNVRGFLGSFMILSTNMGLLLAFVLGNILSYKTNAICLMILPILFTIGFVFFPETPQSLLKNEDFLAAEKSLRFYRNITNYSTTEELQLLKSEINEMSEVYKVKEANNSLSKSIKNFSHPATAKAFLIGLALAALNQFNGNFTMLNYTTTLFTEAGSTLTPNLSAIVIGSIQCLGAFLSTNLVERAGRKVLIGISALGIGIVMGILTVYSYYKHLGYDMESLKWIPLTTFSVSVFLANMGVLNLPFLVISEIMPEKIRSIGVTICMSTIWFEAFLLLKYFPLVSSAYGMHVPFFIFTLCSFAGSLFVFLVMPETKGKSFDEILKMLSK